MFELKSETPPQAATGMHLGGQGALGQVLDVILQELSKVRHRHLPACALTRHAEVSALYSHALQLLLRDLTHRAATGKDFFFFRCRENEKTREREKRRWKVGKKKKKNVSRTSATLCWKQGHPKTKNMVGTSGKRLSSSLLHSTLSSPAVGSTPHYFQVVCSFCPKRGINTTLSLLG